MIMASNVRDTQRYIQVELISAGITQLRAVGAGSGELRRGSYSSADIGRLAGPRVQLHNYTYGMVVESIYISHPCKKARQ